MKEFEKDKKKRVFENLRKIFEKDEKRGFERYLRKIFEKDDKRGFENRYFLRLHLLPHLTAITEIGDNF